MLIIELDNYDAYRLLCLVEHLAHTTHNDYWIDIANQIKRCLDAQTGGKFFQCSACTDEVHQAMLQADRLTDYGRNDPTS